MNRTEITNRMNKRLSICFVLQGLSAGGIESVVTNLANELINESDLNITLVLMHNGEHLFKPDNRITLIENSHTSVAGNKWIYLLKTIKFLRRTFRRNRYDYVIVNGEWINTFVYLSTFPLIKNIYFWDHSNPFRPNQSPYKHLDKLAYSMATGTIVLSQAAQKKMNESTRQNNIILIDNFIKLPEVQSIHNKENWIICAGRLSKEKGQLVLLDAFNQIKNYGYQLILLGDGQLRNELEQKIQQYQLQDQVILKGNVNNVGFYLSKAKIAVVPSHSENFPLFLIEAMATELPVVMTDCISWRGDDQFIMHNVNGLKVPVDNPDAMAESIKLLIENEALRMKLGQNAGKIRDRFAPHKNIQNFKQALEMN